MFRALQTLASKLVILAGIPVVGVLLLSGQVAKDAHARARSAEAIGTLEDLAELTSKITDTVDQLQAERAAAALTVGFRVAGSAAARDLQRANASLQAEQLKTERAVERMDAFVFERDVTRLPTTLQDNVARARGALEQARAERQELLQGTASIARILSSYGNATDALLDTTNSLTHATSDGEVLRALSSLNALLQVKESASQEHALLADSFAAGQFAPGMQQYLATLITEQSVHVDVLQNVAAAGELAAYQKAAALPVFQHSSELVNKALSADLTSNASEWFQVQQSKIAELSRLENADAQAVRDIAHSKVTQALRTVRYAELLALLVAVVSLTLAFAIGRGVTLAIQEREEELPPAPRPV